MAEKCTQYACTKHTIVGLKFPNDCECLKIKMFINIS